MDIQSQIADAIRQELQRQASDGSSRLTFDEADDVSVVHGVLDLEALAMVVTGAVAGGP